MRVVVDGVEGGTIAPDDRGLAYGDGVFETMRAHAGSIPWWPAHWQRLRDGAGRLRIALPPESALRQQVVELLDGGHGVVKLLVTRGAGGRGYAPSAGSASTCVLSTHPVPGVDPDGLVLRWCDTRLSEQPALAGIKHCNRLEQVLARLEWSAPGFDAHGASEGLMLSTGGDVVCATSANLFVLAEGQWTTPPVDRCGVAGVCRQWALQRLHARVERMGPEQVDSADAVFLCNAVRGILPVARLGTRTWSPHPRIDAARRALALDHPAFALIPEPP
ncbi:aminodeoxychorismate lyase [Lysobacter sp. A3-1-A15]|uniref:aminodeoxychorismate lyase n=1 Tax=Novilysobacter viscosus TaxID=3098602 RepID=UPI002EDA24B6